MLRLFDTVLSLVARRSSRVRGHLTYRMLLDLAAIERPGTRR